MSLKGDRSQFEEILVPAGFDSFIEVKCPIPTERTKRSLSTENGFVYGYTVYVSNDGTHYGEGKEIYIFNSACQSPVWNVENATFEITVCTLTFVEVVVMKACIYHLQKQAGTHRRDAHLTTGPDISSISK